MEVDQYFSGEARQPRRLFSTDSLFWRFQRTGQTSFFVFDCYMTAFLIALCWVGLLVVHRGRQKRWYTVHAGKVYSAVHRIHEISIMYVTMAAIVEFIYFEPTSSERFVSAVVCVAFNVYFIAYELYIYYEMMRYPLAEIGNRYYEFYVIRYGCFLKNLRHEEYEVRLG